MLDSIFGTIIAIFGTLGISFVVEKSPIKINPLSIIKKFLVGDIVEKIDKSEEARIKSRANEIKFELSNYEKLISNEIFLTEDDIAFVRELYDEYHKDLKQNHRGTIIYENIENLYKKQQERLEKK